MSFQFLKSVAFACALSGCVAGEYDAPSHMSPHMAAGKDYAITTSSVVARAGKTSQRFEIRHDDCGGNDCVQDRRRNEVIEVNADLEAKPGEAKWYGWSIYLPTDFPDLAPTNTTLGQAKLLGWRQPLWDFNARGGSLNFEVRTLGKDRGKSCRVIGLNQMRGHWTDIVVFTDYSLSNENQRPMTQVWINGRLTCSNTEPVLTNAMLEYTNKNRANLRYGIYNSYVSRWLNNHKTKPVKATRFIDTHKNTGNSISSISARPFDFDWGVKLPTQIVYYDEVRIGETRTEVDIRLRQLE